MGKHSYLFIYLFVIFTLNSLVSKINELLNFEIWIPFSLYKKLSHINMHNYKYLYLYFFQFFFLNFFFIIKTCSYSHFQKIGTCSNRLHSKVEFFVFLLRLN